MEVSTSGYYAWRKRAPSARALLSEDLTVEIKNIFRRSRKSYGSLRIHAELSHQGICCGRKLVSRLMQAHGLRARHKRGFGGAASSKPELPAHPNVLDRQFTAAVPNERWASDITYIWTREGWIYLAVVLGLFNRQIVGWSTGSAIDQELVLRALNMALCERKPMAGLLHHSDRGCQYAGRAYQEQLQTLGITCSMSRRGNCWDSAVVESFFSTLKTEMTGGRIYHTRSDAHSDIFEYIEIWYNRRCRHSTLGYLSPLEFERKAVRVE